MAVVFQTVVLAEIRMNLPCQNGLERVAVVIPAYNHSKYVADAIQSAAAQGPIVTEIIVVDDGSTDGTAEAVRQINEPRLRLLIQPHRGPSATRNAGWRATQADWIQFLDADDTLAAGALGVLLAAVGRREALVIPYGREEIYGQDFTGAPTLVTEISRRSGNIFAEIALNYQGTIFSASFPRESIETVNGFDERVAYGEDYDFALRIARTFEFVHVPAAVYRARMHSQNRHRQCSPLALQDCLAAVDRAMASEASLSQRIIGRRARAHWHWRMGNAYRAAGDEQEARAAFRRSWLQWPFRLHILWHGLVS